jgi:cysteine desulfurase
MKTIYTDNNATTQIAPEVYQAVIPYLTEDYFNPSSMYEAARGSAEAIAQAREGTAKANPTRRHIITTAVEHPAVLEVCEDLERSGYELDYVSVDESGRLKTDEFVRALRPDTLLVTIMHANNETGVIFPIEELSRLTKETDPSIVFHTDATQSMTKLPIDLTGNFQHVDLLSFSGHKLHAPKGVGTLYLRRGTRCRPLMIGGHQESGRRAGTENVAFIVGLAKALEVASQEHDESEKRIRELRDRLERSILEQIPEVRINGKDAPRLPNTCNVSIHYVEGEGMLYQLSAEGICASSGSACTSGSLDPSHVLKAMKVPFTAAHGSIRFSFSRYNTEDDVDHILEVFPGIVASLRRISPYWDDQKNQPRPEAVGMDAPR